MMGWEGRNMDGREREKKKEERRVRRREMKKKIGARERV